MVQGYVIQAEGFQVRFERLTEGMLIEVTFDPNRDADKLFRDELTGAQIEALGQWLLEPNDD